MAKKPTKRKEQISKQISRFTAFAATAFLFTAMAFSMRKTQSLAATKTLANEQMPDAAKDLGGYDCTKDELIKDAIRGAKESIDVTGFGITKENIDHVHLYIIRTFPDMCSSPGWRYSFEGENVTKLMFTYSKDRQAVLSQYEELERVKDQILAKLSPEMTDVEKALALHDHIVSHCAYDSKNAESTDGGEQKYPEEDSTAYGVLVHGRGICQGYSMAYAYLLQSCDIPCLYVSSENANHAWNLAYLDGHWRHIDTTWDDPTWDKLGYVGHHWFLNSTQTMLSYNADKADFIATDKGGDVRPDASDRSLETGFWKATNAYIHYYKGAWHYIDKDSFEICAYNFHTKEQTNILQKKEIWKVWEKPSVYTQSQAKVTAFGKDFYYTTPDGIWKLDLESKKEARIFQADTKNGYVYGLGTIGGDLYYVQKKTPDEERPEAYLPLNQSVAHPGSSHEWKTAHTLPPICTRDGETAYECAKSGCNAAYKKSIPKNEQAHDYKEDLVRAHYEQDGSLTTLCRNCGAVQSTKIIYAPKTMKLSSYSYKYDKKIKNPKVTFFDRLGNKIPKESFLVTYSKKNSKYPGRYIAHVEFTGSYSGGFSCAYFITPPNVKIQKTTPKKGAFQVSWKSKNRKLADGYEIYYSPSSVQGQEKTIKISGASTSQTTIKNLSPGETYWIYLRAYKNTDEKDKPLYSEWSKGCAVTVL